MEGRNPNADTMSKCRGSCRTSTIPKNDGRTRARTIDVLHIAAGGACISPQSLTLTFSILRDTRTRDARAVCAS